MPEAETAACETRDLSRLVQVRVAIVSDTHGFLDPRIAAAVADHDCAVHAGDVGGASVLGALEPRRGVVLAVRGNNDVAAKWPEPDRGLLDTLPGVAWLELPGGALAVVHGDRAGRPAVRHQRLRGRFPEARIVVFGHSHRRCVDKSARPWLVNPGAAGRARAYGGPGFLSLTASASAWRIRTRTFDPL